MKFSIGDALSMVLFTIALAIMVFPMHQPAYAACKAVHLCDPPHINTAAAEIVAPPDMWWCNLERSRERRMLCISHASIQQEQRRKAAEKH